MTLLEWVLSAASALAWVWLAFLHGRFWRIGPFPDGMTDVRGENPSVCVIVPARNEAEVLPRTLPALLSQDYAGPLRVVLVNDHSSDGTAAAARGVAQKMSNDAPPRIRLQVLDAPPLEAGWAGKLWALNQGVRHAEDPASLPEYYLFTDADILHHAGSVRELVAKAQGSSAGGSIDLVSLMVKLRCESFWEKLLIPAYVFFFQKLYPFSWSNDPGAKTAAAAGGCVLIRAETLEKIGGLAAIRSAIIDDCALARAVKRGGGVTWLGLTDSVRSLRGYDSLRPLWNMVARTAFTQLRYSWLLLAGTLAGLGWLYLWAPAQMIAGIATGNVQRILAGGLIWAGMASVYRPMTRFYDLGWARAFALPLIALLYAGMTFTSAWRHLRGQTGNWKGRNYFEAVARR